MTLQRIHRQIPNITTGTTVDIVYGTRGGILLDLILTWKPRTFFNIGTVDELIKPGDIHVIIGDAATSQAILGQDLVNFSPIVVATGDSWSWTNLFADELLDSMTLIERLAFRAITPMPVGVMQGNFRIIASWDPLKQVEHDMIVEANILAFTPSAI